MPMRCPREPTQGLPIESSVMLRLPSDRAEGKAVLVGIYDQLKWETPQDHALWYTDAANPEKRDGLRLRVTETNSACELTSTISAIAEK